MAFRQARPFLHGSDMCPTDRDRSRNFKIFLRIGRIYASTHLYYSMLSVFLCFSYRSLLGRRVFSVAGPAA